MPGRRSRRDPPGPLPPARKPAETGELEAQLAALARTEYPDLQAAVAAALPVATAEEARARDAGTRRCLETAGTGVRRAELAEQTATRQPRPIAADQRRHREGANRHAEAGGNAAARMEWRNAPGACARCGVPVARPQLALAVGHCPRDHRDALVGATVLRAGPRCRTGKGRCRSPADVGESARE